MEAQQLLPDIDPLALIPAEVPQKELDADQKQLDKMTARGEFPQKVAISPRKSAYVLAEYLAWKRERVDRRGEYLAMRESPNPLAKKNRQRLAAGA